MSDDTEQPEAEQSAEDIAALAKEWEAAAEAEEGADGERVLDQDEIDSLLGVGDGDDDDSTTGVMALINSAMVNYERLPMLEVVFDRMVRLMSTSLRRSSNEPLTGMSAAARASSEPGTAAKSGNGMPRSLSARTASVGATSATPTSSMSPCDATPAASRFPITP